jgi:hypothetical protein
MEQQTFHGGYLWWKISTGETTAPSYTIGSANSSVWVLAEFSGNDTHAPLGVRDPTCDRVSGLLTVYLDRPAGKVVTSWADTDETLSLYGITAGASVGVDRVYLRFTKGGEMLPCQSVQLALKNGNVWFGGIMLPTT